MKLVDRLSDKILVRLGSRLEKVRSGIASATLPSFAGPAPGLEIKLPRELGNPRLVRFGRDVKIGPNSVIKATTSFPGSWLRHPEGEHVGQEFSPRIEFGDRVTATWGLQVVAFERISVEDDVMFAGNVYVSDGRHATARGDAPYKYQGIDNVAPVSIGRGSWIGQNVVILPGVTIGEYAVIGANSVVGEDLPPGSLAVGAPAEVVRRWDGRQSTWERPSTDGPFSAAERGA